MTLALHVLLIVIYYLSEMLYYSTSHSKHAMLLVCTSIQIIALLFKLIWWSFKEALQNATKLVSRPPPQKFLLNNAKMAF